jgi:hypothetical protein
MLAAESAGRNPALSISENTDDRFVGNTLLHRVALTLLIKTLLISWWVNQPGAGHKMS